MQLTLWSNCNIATLQPEAAHAYGLITDACLVIDGSQIHWVGKLAELPNHILALCTEHHDAHGALDYTGSD